MTEDVLSATSMEEGYREMKIRYTPFLATIVAYAFLALGLAAGPATVWALFPLPLHGGPLSQLFCYAQIWP